MSNASNILTLNSGSSSLKFAIYQIHPEEKLLLSGKADRIGLNGGHVKITRAGQSSHELKADLQDQGAAIRMVFEQLRDDDVAAKLSAIGHRIVMGGPNHSEPQRVTPDLLQELSDLCRIDPAHLPPAIKTIEAAEEFRPGIPQVACFDTAFHRSMPKVAQTYALPRSLGNDSGILRYGFHGLSYEYILSELQRIDSQAASGKVVIAHLGNGASMVALHKGRSLDTTMGFTPAGGLVMSSRLGDIDPGVLVQLITQRHMKGSELNDLIYKQSGLLGVSGVSSDMQDLTREKDRNPNADEAIALFCYQAKKFLGALVAVLDGIETLIFTGGIGENAGLVRARVCAGLSHLGVQIDPATNAAHADVISMPDSRVVVRVIKTNEELMIARHTVKLLTK